MYNYIIMFSNTCLNEKGAEAFVSTSSPIIDLFGLSKTRFENNLSLEEFTTIFETCYKAYLHDSKKYVSLLKHRRDVDKMGQKMMYYIMISIIRKNNPEKYLDILRWSHGYKKDLLRLARIFNMADIEFSIYSTPQCYTNINISGDFKNSQTYTFSKKQSTNSIYVSPELELYSDYIISKINSGESDMCFKYIGTDHFYLENMIIKKCINKKLEHCGIHYTNSQFRKLFSNQKKKLFLIDELLKGFKNDGTPLLLGDEQYVVEYLKKTSSQTFQNIKNTIQKFAESTKEYQKVLWNAYKLLEEEAKQNKLKLKVKGLSLSQQCYSYFTSHQVDNILEATLDKKLENLKNQELDEKSKIDIVIDNSVSMHGAPIQNATYIALMLTSLLNLDSILYFNTSCKRVFTDGSKWFEKIKTLYKATEGSTNMSSIFSHLENNNNTTIILTDGDCDPTLSNKNPFREALELFPNRKFIVWNLKESKLHFPYCVDDDRVGYISGNDPTVIESVFKTILKNEFNPETVLESCIDDIHCPFSVEANDVPFTVDELVRLHHSILENLPPSKKEDLDFIIDIDEFNDL